MSMFSAGPRNVQEPRKLPNEPRKGEEGSVALDPWIGVYPSIGNEIPDEVVSINMAAPGVSDPQVSQVQWGHLPRDWRTRQRPGTSEAWLQDASAASFSAVCLWSHCSGFEANSGEVGGGGQGRDWSGPVYRRC
ncbi:hypothetical protein LIA77_05024 [Sarocladium implicatum]|nr:hypothetical protein LIA77_05024 [Sarocladium implicatum]